MRPSRSICFKSLCEIKKSNKQLFSESTLYEVLCKENYYKKVICNRLAQSTVEIYQWVFPKVAALKHFTKGVMISSFHGAPRKRPSTRKKNQEMQSLIKLPKSLCLRHLDFLKVAILKQFAKKAMTSSFPGGSSTKASTSKLLS